MQSEHYTVNIPISALLIEDHEEKMATHQEHAEYSLVVAVLYGFSGLSMGSTKEGYNLQYPKNLKNP